MVQPHELEEEMGIGTVPPEFLPAASFYPGNGIPVLIKRDELELDYFYWGLIPSWASDIKIARSTFNARSETLNEKPSFRNAFRRRRCLIPSSGFYETDRKSELKRQYFITIENHPLFTFAGLWDHWMDKEGNEIFSATMITCPANDAVGKIHDRMPVILAKEDRDFWLEDHSPADLQSVLLPYEADLTRLTPL
jgi:putative SOS response-associated peptidase YedK